VGESNIDRAIGDMMTASNPTVGLAAHAGQTDVRITAKADTEAEADALIASVEAELRQRLGIAIYGVDKETVPEVVGRILTEQGLRLGVVDTLTGGQLVRELAEAGYGPRIAADLHPGDPAEALQALGHDSASLAVGFDGASVAATLARAVAPADGVGLTLAGPFEHNTTFIALQGPGDLHLLEPGRNHQQTDYVRRWLVIQGLDWVRRAVLGQLTSPADWK
jgi:nicotinamide-nucleotide amidase